MTTKNVTLVHQIQASERAVTIAEGASALIVSCHRLLELEPRIAVEINLAKTHLEAVTALAATSLVTLNAIIDTDGDR